MTKYEALVRELHLAQRIKDIKYIDEYTDDKETPVYEVQDNLYIIGDLKDKDKIIENKDTSVVIENGNFPYFMYKMTTDEINAFNQKIYDKYMQEMNDELENDAFDLEYA